MMEKRIDTSSNDHWLERALARWEWEGGHVAPRVEENTTSGAKERIAPSQQDERITISSTVGKRSEH
jgi:hypothetical protein